MATRSPKTTSRTTKSPSRKKAKKKRVTYIATRASDKYKAGRRGEYKSKALLESSGYLVSRAASSKGIADLVAVDRTGKAILVQVKVGKKGISVVEREQLKTYIRTHKVAVMVHRWIPYVRTPMVEIIT